MRTVIIHSHLFKNAGTTLDWSLARYFGRRFVNHTDDAQMRTGAAYLGPYLQKNKRLAAVSSHHVRLPLPTLDGVTIIPALLLRHPIDRIGSVYTFEKRQQSQTPGAVNAKKMTFAEYVAWRMEPTSGATIRNFHIRYCCGRLVRLKQPITQEDFDASLRLLESTPLMGIVEHYDESMVLFEEALQHYFPKISLAYVRQNVSKGRKATLAERVQHVYDRLSPDVSALVDERNAWDHKLYEAAKALLMQRIAAMPDFVHRLADFRERCRHVETIAV